MDKNPAYPKAIKELKAAKKLPEIVKLRQIKYLNNIVEQDHRGIKRLVKPGMGIGSFSCGTPNNQRIWNYKYDEKRTSFRTSLGSRQRTDSLHQPNLWSGFIIRIPTIGIFCPYKVFTTQPDSVYARDGLKSLISWRDWIRLASISVLQLFRLNHSNISLRNELSLR